jgi:hypothetical protein
MVIVTSALLQVIYDSSCCLYNSLRLPVANYFSVGACRPFMVYVGAWLWSCDTYADTYASCMGFILFGICSHDLRL